MTQLDLFQAPPVLAVQGFNRLAQFLRYQRNRVAWGNVQPEHPKRVTLWACACGASMAALHGRGLH